MFQSPAAYRPASVSATVSPEPELDESAADPHYEAPQFRTPPRSHVTRAGERPETAHHGSTHPESGHNGSGYNGSGAHGQSAAAPIPQPEAQWRSPWSFPPRTLRALTATPEPPLPPLPPLVPPARRPADANRSTYATRDDSERRPSSAGWEPYLAPADSDPYATREASERRTPYAGRDPYSPPADYAARRDSSNAGREPYPASTDYVAPGNGSVDYPAHAPLPEPPPPAAWPPRHTGAPVAAPYAGSATEIPPLRPEPEAPGRPPRQRFNAPAGPDFGYAPPVEFALSPEIAPGVREVPHAYSDRQAWVPETGNGAGYEIAATPAGDPDELYASAPWPDEAETDGPVRPPGVYQPDPQPRDNGTRPDPQPRDNGTRSGMNRTAQPQMQPGGHWLAEAESTGAGSDVVPQRTLMPLPYMHIAVISGNARTGRTVATLLAAAVEDPAHPIAVSDAGPIVNAPAWPIAVEAADQIVVAVDAVGLGPAEAAGVLDAIAQTPFANRIPGAVTVVLLPPARRGLSRGHENIGAIREFFRSRTRAVFFAPATTAPHAALAPGAPVDPDEPSTVRAERIAWQRIVAELGRVLS